MSQRKILYKLIRRIADGVALLLILAAALFAMRAI
jgi:hypothetical protein